MKRVTQAIAAAALVIVGICLAPALTRAAPEREAKSARPAADHPLLGTWRLASYKYGDAKKFSDAPKEQVRLKHITATHFEWVAYDAQTKMIVAAAGGRQSLDGEAYVEHLEYGLGDGIQPLIGQKQSFHDKVDGDKLHHVGMLSTGVKIEEIWERAKGGE